jgi:hypothetical protein
VSNGASPKNKKAMKIFSSGCFSASEKAFMAFLLPDFCYRLVFFMRSEISCLFLRSLLLSEAIIVIINTKGCCFCQGKFFDMKGKKEKAHCSSQFMRLLRDHTISQFLKLL